MWNQVHVFIVQSMTYNKECQMLLNFTNLCPIIDNFNISENVCVCKKCDLKFIQLFSRSQECPDESCMSALKKTCKDDPCFLSYFNACDHQADH
jgi:hypothetical protein